MTQELLFRNLISHAKEYGFIFQSSEIYDGLGAVYDYGQLGVELKNNLKQFWWQSMVRMHDNIVGIDSAIFMHPKVWEASGHLSAFNDPLIDNRVSKKRYRADVLLEEYVAKQEERIEREVERGIKRFGDAFDREQFIATNPNVLRITSRLDPIKERISKAFNDNDLELMRDLIIELDIVCPVSGSKEWTDVRQFNLMFSTRMGSTDEGASTIYLRPESAQGIFVNFLNVQKSARLAIPFGIAQIGKAFRNEIVARQFIFRMREFEQMEMQFFVKPGEELDWYEHWKAERLKWHQALGLGDENYQFKDHEKMAHYANAAVDIEYKFPFGFREVEGIHSRTDFDLAQHQEFSGKRLQYFDPQTKESYIPCVVETSIGLDRTVLSVLSGAYQHEELEGGESRVVMKFPPFLAPVKLAILPLTRRDGLPDIAREILDDVRFDFNCQYDEKDSIGRRYRRQDAIGTPLCITVDHQTKEDNTVTIRYRDSMEQERIPIEKVREVVDNLVNFRVALDKLK